MCGNNRCNVTHDLRTDDMLAAEYAREALKRGFELQERLERLERKGFLESRVGGEQARQGGRRKRLFTLLPQGGDVLRRTRAAREALWGLTEASDG